MLPSFTNVQLCNQTCRQNLVSGNLQPDHWLVAQSALRGPCLAPPSSQLLERTPRPTAYGLVQDTLEVSGGKSLCRRRRSICTSRLHRPALTLFGP
jgi:hypothetical protein